MSFPSLRTRLRTALREAMRARDKVATGALRSALAALDNAEAVPLEASGPRAGALEQSPVGVGATEAARRELDERAIAGLVRAEADERVAVAGQLTSDAHADRAARLRAEAAVLLRLLDAPNAALQDVPSDHLGP